MRNDKKRYVVDRIEGDIVVCENMSGEQMEEFALEIFGERPADGLIFFLEEGRAVPDIKETEARKAMMEERFRSLRKD